MALDRVASIQPARAGEPGFRVDVDALTLYPGDLIGLVGPSGSGKSTILDTIALVQRPGEAERFELRTWEGDSRRQYDLARIQADGDERQLTALRARWVGYITQGGALLPYLSVQENARLAARLGGAGDGSDPGDRIQALAETIGIGALLNRRPSELSGGEKQRASVLRCLASGASVLVADEPTAALDPERAEEVMSQIVRAAEEFGAAVVCASHDEKLLERSGFLICDVRSLTPDETGQRRAVLEPRHG